MQSQFARRLRVVVLTFPALWPLSSHVHADAVATPEAENSPSRVVVTARKREEATIDVPVAVTNFSEQALHDYDIHSFIDYANKTPNLSFAYGNGGTAGNPATAFADARTTAIRGIAGARTTGFYVDDIPLPGAVDVRIVDIKNIDILKGPQGTLYGEGSVGGSVRLATKAPNLVRNEFRSMLEAGITQGGNAIDRGAEAVANVVLAPGKAALRIAAFADSSAGYLTRTYRSDIGNPDSPRIGVDNQGAQRNLAGSITALLRATDDLDITLRLMGQNQYNYGFPAAYAPLPAFKPIPVLDHVANIQTGVSDIWNLPSLSFNYRGNGWTLVSSTSHFSRRTWDLEDSTEGTSAYWGATIPQPIPWVALHNSRQLSHETRLSFDSAGPLSGTIGFFYSNLHTDFIITPTYALLGAAPGASSLIWKNFDANAQRNLALFGEFYYKFLERFTLTAGVRRYWLDQHDDLSISYLDVDFRSVNDNRSTGYSPKFALAYQASRTAMLYASAAKGFRQGNAQFDASGFGCDASLAAIGQTPLSMTKIQPDSVWSYETGGKFEFPDPGLLLTASAFHMDWDRIQQPIFLQSCGFYMQGNAGAAKIDGAELELSGRLTPSFMVRAGLGYEHARITQGGNTGQPVGSQVYQVPTWTATLGGIYTYVLDGGTKGFIAATYSHTGSSLSANSGAGLNLVRPPYRLLNARIGLDWGQSELSLNIKNLSNEMPNLGDIGYIGYQRYVPGTTTPIPQVATLPPRTIMLQYRRSF
jgi:iron complex outermembrane recepter protein